ncbi:MAG: GIY-YIG nuclease family protein [Rhodospirillaceae bacterium]
MMNPHAFQFSNGGGCYALHIWLEKNFVRQVGSLGNIFLPVGSYLYLGNARGTGGLRARISRHCRSDKRIHWHVDHLTSWGRVLHVWTRAQGSECNLREVFMQNLAIQPAVKGFGSTNCNICPSHLLAMPSLDSSGICENITETLEISGVDFMFYELASVS